MEIWLILGLKVGLAGLGVAAFSLFSTATRPKTFSGLFAGAPVVASASLLITAVQKPAVAALGATGMVAGAVGMVACCMVAGLFLPRMHALGASAVAWAAWAAVAVAVFVVVLS